MASRRLAVLALAVLTLACSAEQPARMPAAVPSEPASEVEFPPHGPVELRLSRPPPEGTLYQLQVRYEGRTEVQDESANARDPELLDELLQLELDYRQVPVATPEADDSAYSLVLDALRRRMRVAPPGTQRSLEIGDDRIRTLIEDKIEIDLRGAQPKGDLTPRVLLNRPFALLVTDARGNPKGVTLRGIPTAKRLLASLPIREAVAFLQVGLPEQPVGAGATWTAKRFFANPIGRLGVGVDIEHRLVGFERVDGVPCARVSLRAAKDSEQAPSEFGFLFEKLRFELEGDAWISLASGELQRLRIEDIAAVSYRRTTGANPASIRSRYEGRASLQRLDVATTSKLPWADGTKRFSEVNTKSSK